MKPLIYGYMRVTDEWDDDQLRETEQQLARHAEAGGYRLGAIFHNCTPGRLNTLTALVDALRRSGARHVIVPSLEHLARHPLLQEQLIELLETGAQAQVIEVGEPW
jgi:Resolvase, N terminal domain